MGINWLAAIVAGLAGFGVGAVWYAVLFRNAWAKLMPFDPMSPGGYPAPVAMGGAAVLSVIAAIVFAIFLGPNPSFNFAVGAAYKWDRNLTLRAGYQYDPTPTDDSARDTRVPDSDRNWITAGLTYNFDDRFSVDVSAAWIFMSNNDISVTRNAGLAAVNAENGDSSIGLVAVGLNTGF